MPSFASQRSILVGLTALLVWTSATIWSAVTSASKASSLPASESVRVITLTANDIVYNAADDKLYASIPSSAGATGNSIRQIDPRNGNVGDPVWVGSEPDKLAMANDGQSLYISLYGAASIRRFNTSTQTPGPQFPLGFDSSTRFNTSDFAVSPDDANVVAVRRHYEGSPYNNAGIAIFNNGVQLPQATTGSLSSEFIAFSASGSTLYGSGGSSGLQTLAVSTSGVTVGQTSQVIRASHIKFGNGMIFSSDGHVVQASNHGLLGTFPGVSTFAFVPDTNVGRCYFADRDELNQSFTLIKAFDINTFTLVGSLAIPTSAEPETMIRWGANGLALRMSDGQILIVQTTLIPSAEPIPIPTATVTPTITPTPTPFSTYVNAIPTRSNSVVYHSATQRIYASVPSTTGNTGNSIAKIDPISGNVEERVWIGSEPNKIERASDGHTLYVTLDGSRTIRRFDIATGAPGGEFTVGMDSSEGPMLITDLSVSPNDANVVAVSRNVQGYYSRGVVIFENGIARPQIAANAGGALAFSGSESTLYSDALQTLSVNPTGVMPTVSVPFNTGGQLEYLNGLIYGSTGRVIDPGNGALQGTFQIDDPFSTHRPFVIDEAAGRIFFAFDRQLGLEIRAYEIHTYRHLGTITLVGFKDDPQAIERWGANGLAVSTRSGPTLLIQSNLVEPSSPVPTTTPTPPPTPTPTPAATFIRRIDLPNNDLVYNQADGIIYASIPGVADSGLGNTITRIQPQTGEVIGSVFIGSEPKKLALSDDGQTLYSSLNGTNAVRRYDVQTHSAGPQFTPANGGHQTYDMSVLPGNPQTVIVSAGNGGVGIYDNGVRRQNPVNTIHVGPVEHNGTTNMIYGFDNTSSGFYLHRFAVNQNGLTTASTVQNLVSGFYTDFYYTPGKLYCNNGRIVDPETNRILGTFFSTGTSVIADTTLGRVFILSDRWIDVFDASTYNRIGRIDYPFDPNTVNHPSSLVRWGANGLAFRVETLQGARFMFVVQSQLVSQNGFIPVGHSLEAAAKNTPESAPTVSISVSRTGDLTAATSVDFSTSDGTASAGSDYTATSGMLTFAPGETSKTITIPILNDNIREGNENFNIALSNPIGNGSTIVSPSASVITVTDDDPMPFIRGFSTTVLEPPVGQARIAEVVVSLQNPSVQTITLTYSTGGGTAQPGSDYLPANGMLTFAPLETSKILPVTVVGDGLAESTESFTVSLTPTSPTSRGVLLPLPVVTIQDSAEAPFDFDGDGKTDIGIFRPSVAEWWYSGSSDSQVRSVQFGASDDVIAPGDITGDGKADIMFFRPSTGFWFVLRSEDSSFFSFPFGASGDIPVPADYDADGRTDAAVFRPSTGTWFVLQSGGGGTAIFPFGAAGDVPVAADYDGDGKADAGIYRVSDGSWWILRSTGGTYIANFGSPTDKPVPGDYTADGKTDIAIFRPSNGEWFILRSEDGSYFSFVWGASGDIAAPGDYDGDGKFDASIFRPSQTTWYINRSGSTPLITQFGAAGDRPIPNAFVP